MAIIIFIAGMGVGGFFGVMTMALMVAAREDDNEKFDIINHHVDANDTDAGESDDPGRGETD